VASFAHLAGHAVIADCDVDAADLHIVLAPTDTRTRPFVGGQVASLNGDACSMCGECREACRFGAIEVVRSGSGQGEIEFRVQESLCEGCGVCEHVCPQDAIELIDSVDGEWSVSDTRYGPFIHARLTPGAGNSGKLVTRLRREAERLAAEQGCDLVLVDGSPGIGCPVIASLTGASTALAVAEPSASSLHDLTRVVEVARQLRVPVAVCLNKWDVSEEGSHELETWCRVEGIPLVGRIPYDSAVTEAQLEARPVVAGRDTPASRAISAVWESVSRVLEQQRGELR